jgi:hypothetical protein
MVYVGSGNKSIIDGNKINSGNPLPPTPPIKPRQTYTILLESHNGMPMTYTISSSENLVHLYQRALLNGMSSISWEDGVLDVNKIVGIFNPYPIKS